VLGPGGGVEHPTVWRGEVSGAIIGARSGLRVASPGVHVGGSHSGAKREPPLVSAYYTQEAP